MSGDGKLASKIKSLATRFASRLSKGSKRVTVRMVRETVLGIQASKSVKVSEIARALGEGNRLISTEVRLCRRLADEDLTDQVNRRIAWEAGADVDSETVLAVDLGDVSKPHAKRMEHLADARDGSTGEIGPGYWLSAVVAAHPHGDKVTPLYGELYSAAAEDFRSENEQIFRAVAAVSEATGGRGVFAIDRGGDRWEVLNFLLDNKLRFVVRQRGDRHLEMSTGRKRRASAVPHWGRSVEKHTVEIERDGKRERLALTVSVFRTALPGRAEALWLVKIEGFGEKPLLLLTNVPPPEGRGHGQWIMEIYLTRWKCEEAYRFLKQAYGVEDVRVRSYTALRNLYVLAHAVFYFVSRELGQKARLSILFKKVCEKAKRFFETPSFFHYALADGIHRLLFERPLAPAARAPEPDDRQGLLPFARPPD